MDEFDGDKATRFKPSSVGWVDGICRLGGPRKMAFSVLAAVMQDCNSRAKKKYSILIHICQRSSWLKVDADVDVDIEVQSDIIGVRLSTGGCAWMDSQSKTGIACTKRVAE